MRGIGSIALVTAALAMIVAGCLFKPQPFKGVISYRHGKVYIRTNRYYTVGQLPEGWGTLKSRARTISFYNEEFKSSISTDAYCGRSVGDRSLDSLTGDIITALEGRTVRDQTSFMLDGRGALRQRVAGTVDGVAALVDLVIVRKDLCVFDFYVVMPAAGDPQATRDFEAFFNGFHYDEEEQAEAEGKGRAR